MILLKPPSEKGKSALGPFRAAHAAQRSKRPPRATAYSAALRARLRKKLTTTHAEELSEQIVLRIAVAEMLSITLGEGDSRLHAARGRPIAHRLHILIHAVM